MRAILDHFADKLLFSVKGLAPGNVLTDANPLEAEVKRTMIDRARESILLIDGSKLDNPGLSAIAPVRRDRPGLVADAGAAPSSASLAETGIRVDEVA